MKVTFRDIVIDPLHFLWELSVILLIVTVVIDENAGQVPQLLLLVKIKLRTVIPPRKYSHLKVFIPCR
jgi:hypothetical protein